jgi:hypothetical protein
MTGRTTHYKGKAARTPPQVVSSGYEELEPAIGDGSGGSTGEGESREDDVCEHFFLSFGGGEGLLGEGREEEEEEEGKSREMPVSHVPVRALAPDSPHVGNSLRAFHPLECPRTIFAFTMALRD